MRPVAGWLFAISMVAGPAMAAGPDGEPDPCRNTATRRIAIVFAQASAATGAAAHARERSIRRRRRCVRATRSSGR